MIDWLTLRIPVYDLAQNVRDKLASFCGAVYYMDAEGVIQWEKLTVDIEKLRSDSVGLFWQIQSGGNDRSYLVVGASPASIEHSCNVFGSDDIRHCAEVLIRAAARALGCFLPALEAWQCRRLDITQNYDLGTLANVRQALRYLSLSELSSRTRTSTKGDTVYILQSAERQSGKFYAKGPQLERMLKKHPDLFPAEYTELAQPILRAELTIKRKWWVENEEPELVEEDDRPADMARTPRHREYPANWFEFTPEMLRALHEKFFGRFIGSVEVVDMDSLMSRLLAVAPTKGQAKAAYQMYCAIKADGLEIAKQAYYTKDGTKLNSSWYRNLAHLFAAGLSTTDVGTGTVVPLRRDVIRISDPVTCWADLRRAA